MRRRIGVAATVLAVGVLVTTMGTVPATAGSDGSVASHAQSATTEPPTTPCPSSATASSTFQVAVGAQSFSACLPVSSVATYTWTPNSSTVDAWDTTASATKLTEELTPEQATLGTTSDSVLPTIKLSSSPEPDRTIDGFGGAMTESAAYVINNSSQKSTILSDLFGNSGADADFKLVRLPLGASDLVTGPIYPEAGLVCKLLGDAGFTYDDNCGTADPTLAHFSIGTRSSKGATAKACSPATSSGEYGTGDFADTIPALLCAKSINKQLKLMALPWSAPGWMKNSGHYLSTCSGSSNYLKTADYPVYAEYLTKAAKAYQDEGLPFSILSMQNEPHNCNPTYPTMMMQPSDQAKLSLDLRADLNNPADGLTNPPKIMGWDHNWNDYNNGPSNTPCSDQTEATYPQSLLKLPNAVSDIGYHSYCGNSYVPTFPDAEGPSGGNPGIYVTESTGEKNNNDPAVNLVNEVKDDLIDPINNGASGSLYWNLALNQHCGPQFGGGTTCNYCSESGSPPSCKSCPKPGNQPAGTTCNQKESNSYSGCMDCRPMITVNGNAKPVLNEDYYYRAQFSKFVEPGAQVIGSSPVETLDTVAFQNPPSSQGGNGKTVLVVLNNSTPSISSFNATPTTLTSSGGSVTLSANVADASTCAFSSTPAITGLPASAGCPNGTGNETVTIPANTTTSPLTYTFNLSATGASTVNATPVTVTEAAGSSVEPSLAGVQSVASDGQGSCAVLSTGGVDCWGYNIYGQLGSGVVYGPDGEYGYDTPQPVTGLTDAVSVTSVGYGYCALLSTGGVDCWGDNGFAELGNGTTGGSDGVVDDTPQPVSGITNAVSVTQRNALCSRPAGWTVGATTGTASWATVRPAGPTASMATTRPSQSPASLTLYLLITTTMRCALDRRGGLLGRQRVRPVGQRYDRRARWGGWLRHAPAGHWHLRCCLGHQLRLWQRLLCRALDRWGGLLGVQRRRELGNGTVGGPDGEYGYDTPQPVTGVSDAASVSAGESSNCALLSTGAVDCWGWNVPGQLGNGTVGGPDGSDNPGYDTPQAVTGVNDAISVVSAGFGAGFGAAYCAVLSTGEADCWGNNGEGDLGNGTFYGPDGENGYDTPQMVAGITDVISVTDNGDGYCAVLSTGGVDCWGSNERGQLGNGRIDGTGGATDYGYDTPQPVLAP